MLKGVKRRSARTVLSWLKSGFKPKWEGTKNAKKDKKQIVESMLRRVVGNQGVARMLMRIRPHKVEFQNHQSFYQNWEFSADQVEKLVEWGAAGIWEGPEPPEVINPMGVVESAGKLCLICNNMYINLFLEALPFRYERLRDILSSIDQGSYMATWDLKSEYFHVSIHPDSWKYFCFRVGGVVFYFWMLCFGFASSSLLRVHQDYAGASDRAQEKRNSVIRLHRRWVHGRKNLQQMSQTELTQRSFSRSLRRVLGNTEMPAETRAHRKVARISDRFHEPAVQSIRD